MKTLTSQDVFTMIRNHLFLHHTAKKGSLPSQLLGERTPLYHKHQLTLV